jgi:hypothetical protein
LLPEKWTPRGNWFLVTFNQAGRSVSVKVAATSEQNARHKVFWNHLRQESKLENPPCHSGHNYEDFVEKGAGVKVEDMGAVPHRKPQHQTQFDF